MTLPTDKVLALWSQSCDDLEGIRQGYTTQPLFFAALLQREMEAENAGLRSYAIALKKAAEPFCAIKADDGDTFNGYAPETIIRFEASVQEIRRLRICAGYGLPSSGTAADNSQEKP